MIHPTAIIDPKAEIENNVSVGPYAIVGKHVSIGANTIVGSHAVIDPYVTIENNCHIFQHVAIGAIPQSLRFSGEKSFVKIGSGTIIREFTTINRGTAFGGGMTEIGNTSYLMAYTHIAHDCKVGHNVIFANNVTLAGHVTIGNYANISGFCGIHQFVNIGGYVFIGPRSTIVKDVPPYVLANGDRATLHGLNSIGLKRQGFSSETLSLLKKAYRIFFRNSLTLKDAITRVETEVDQIPEVIHLIEFIKKTERGITR
jgi:UDP-N-acetylglucosamine acyltransferase